MTRTAKIVMVAVLAASPVQSSAGLGRLQGPARPDAAGGTAATHVRTPRPSPRAPERAVKPLQQSSRSLQPPRLTQAPSDWKSLSRTLGLAYVLTGARSTADPTYYPKAEGALATSLSLQPRQNEAALVGEAALAAGRHDFTGALRYGERARALNPHDANVYGVIGDAENGLGRYPAAFATFQTMVDTLPNLSFYARVSYARELQCDVPGALEAMRYARDVAGMPADVAWASFQTW